MAADRIRGDGLVESGAGDSVGWMSTALFLGANIAWYYYHYTQHTQHQHTQPQDPQSTKRPPPSSSKSRDAAMLYDEEIVLQSNDDEYYFQRRLEHRLSFPRYVDATQQSHQEDPSLHPNQHQHQHQPLPPPSRVTSLTDDEEDDDETNHDDPLHDTTRSNFTISSSKYSVDFYPKNTNWQHFECFNDDDDQECQMNEQTHDQQQRRTNKTTSTSHLPPPPTPLQSLFVREISSSEQPSNRNDPSSDILMEQHDANVNKNPPIQHDNNNDHNHHPPLHSAAVVEDTVERPGSMTLTRETKEGQGGAIYISLEGERTVGRHSLHNTATHASAASERYSSSDMLLHDGDGDGIMLDEEDDDGVSSMDDEVDMGHYVSPAQDFSWRSYQDSRNRYAALPVILSERQIHTNNSNNNSPHHLEDMLVASSPAPTHNSSSHHRNVLLDESENDAGDDKTDPGSSAFRSAARVSKRYSSQQQPVLPDPRESFHDRKSSSSVQSETAARNVSDWPTVPTGPRAKLNHRSSSIPNVLTRSLHSVFGGSTTTGQVDDASSLPPLETATGPSLRFPSRPNRKSMLARSISAPLAPGRRPSSSASARVVRANYNARIMPSKLILLRHGQSMGNLDETLYSKTADNAIPLTELGWKQARAAGEQLKREVKGSNDVHFIVSPYVRTVETFHGIASAWCDPDGPEFAQITDPLLRRKAWYARLVEMGLSWAEDPRIREQDFGNLQDPAKIKQSKKERNHFGAFYYRFAHGESAADVFDRISTFLDSLWRSFDVHPSRHFVLVTHGISIRVLLARYFRYTIDQFHMLSNPRNCEMICLSHDGRGRLEMSGRHELEVIPNKDNLHGHSHDDVILRYKFKKRLRVLPPTFVRKVKIRISYSETDDTEKSHHEDHE